MSSTVLRVLSAILLISGGCLARERLAFVMRGGSIRLLCPDLGQTQWSRLTWEDVTGEFLGIGRSFSVANATVRDAGVYVCRRHLFQSNRPPRFETSSIRLVVLFHSTAPRVAPLVPPDMTTRRNTGRRVPVPMTRATERLTAVPPDMKTTRARLVTNRRTPPPPSTPTSSLPSAGERERETECADSQVMCPATWNGQGSIRGCISASWVCDGENDCGNRWDESNCNVTGPCQVSTYACENSAEVVPIAYRCDGERDCPNGDDEWNCVSPHYLTPRTVFVETEENATVRLTCAVTGMPRPVITWGDNDKMLPQGSRTEEVCTPLENSSTLLVNSTLILPPSPTLSQRPFYCRVSERAHGMEPSTFHILIRRRVGYSP